MIGISGEIEYYRHRVRQLECAIQRVIDTPAGDMPAEQFKNRISGGLHEALHIKPAALARVVEDDWRDEAEGYIR